MKIVEVGAQTVDGCCARCQGESQVSACAVEGGEFVGCLGVC